MKVIDTTQKVIIPKKCNYDIKSKELLDVLNSVSDHDINNIWDEITEKNEQKRKWEDKKRIKEYVSKDKFKWNARAIIWDLIWNHVKINSDQELLWFKWNIVHLTLPAVWKFKWFNFDYFESLEKINKNDFEKNNEYAEKSFTMKDICELLDAIRSYMNELKVKIDCEINYESRLSRNEKNNRTTAWKYLKEILKLNDMYWLKDCWIKTLDSRVVFDLYGIYWGFLSNNGGDLDAYLLLKTWS